MQILLVSERYAVRCLHKRRLCAVCLFFRHLCIFILKRNFKPCRCFLASVLVVCDSATVNFYIIENLFFVVRIKGGYTVIDLVYKILCIFACLKRFGIFVHYGIENCDYCISCLDLHALVSYFGEITGDGRTVHFTEGCYTLRSGSFLLDTLVYQFHCL